VAHRIGIFGASGYAGGELIRLVDAHPAMEVAYLAAHSKAGATLGEVHPHLSGGDRVLGALDPAPSGDLDLAFLALPHGASTEPALALLERGVRVVDLGSDFRFDSAARYEEAYGTAHPHPEELGRWPYGIPELFRDAVAGSDRVAVPGCYPTAAILALAPLVGAGLIEPTRIVVDAKSGVSGAGRSAIPTLMFGAVDEGVTAYKVLTHRHRPEIEQALGVVAGTAAEVVFTPHLVPMQRGILATCYAVARPGIGQAEVEQALGEAYGASPLVTVGAEPPLTRWVVGSNRCRLSAHVDERTGTVIVLSAIDNLLKGAAGQAVQCANLMLGRDELDGIPTEGWMP
jgi:N-acetyl-gamma-glutamyl-phosphate reductase